MYKGRKRKLSALTLSICIVYLIKLLYNNKYKTKECAHMADDRFNLSQIKDIYFEALHSPDKSLAFDISIGKGNFLFMMFLALSDTNAKDLLFIYMRNTNVLKSTKLYGLHKKGQFYMYINDDLKESLIAELQLDGNGKAFDFTNFLHEINDAIPLSINNDEKIKTFRENKNIIRELNVVDESEKTVFIGSKKLSKGIPREKTLRKLYMYVEADYKTIKDYIDILKMQNKTIAWTTVEHRDKAADIYRLLAQEKI